MLSLILIYINSIFSIAIVMSHLRKFLPLDQLHSGSAFARQLPRLHFCSVIYLDLLLVECVLFRNNCEYRSNKWYQSVLLYNVFAGNSREKEWWSELIVRSVQWGLLMVISGLFIKVVTVSPRNRESEHWFWGDGMLIRMVIIVKYCLTVKK